MCSIEGCDRGGRMARGMCMRHYNRWHKWGDPLVLHRPGVKQGSVLRPVVGYNGAHDRVRSEKGSASEHPCAECHRPAQHWAYDHSDPDQLIWDGSNGRNKGQAYSLKPDHYLPMCVPCHKASDISQRKAVA